MGGKDERSCCQKFKQGCSNFGTFLYRKGEDKDGKHVGLVIGRSCKSWARIGLFYLCFYGFLAGFFAAMLIVFLSTINPATEVGINPEKAGPKLVQFLAHNDLDVAPGLNWVNKLEVIAEKDTVKKKIAEEKRRKSFRDDTETYLSGFNYGLESSACPLGEDGWKNHVPCKPKLNFTECMNATAYKTAFGYDTLKLCLFIKINKVWGWIPMADGNDFLKLDCGSDVTVVNGGFQKSGFPFFGQKGYQAPPALVIVDLTKVADQEPTAKVVQCKLVGKGVVPSDSFNPSRAFGVIELEVPCLHPDCK